MTAIRILLAAATMLAACAASPPPPPVEQQGRPAVPPGPQPAPTMGYDVVRTYPHDPDAFTQGLIYVDGDLYESGSRVTVSTVPAVDLVLP